MSYISKAKIRGTDRYQLSWEQASRWLRLPSRLQWHPCADSLPQWSTSAVETFGQTRSQCGTCDTTTVNLHTKDFPPLSIYAMSRYILFLENIDIVFSLIIQIISVQVYFRLSHLEHHGYNTTSAFNCVQWKNLNNSALIALKYELSNRKKGRI